ncbi:MAG: hypothetical protein GY854_32295 [Deltaproteobacteria bacterium]|nr:hypothetical protein [Deltaproteobacteria bacterium]
MKIITITAIFAALVWAMGCLPDTSGVDPPTDQLIFPVGLAVVGENDNRYLLVANSNFNLKYNAGTIVAVDLKELESIEEKIQPEDGRVPDAGLEYLSEDKKDLFIPDDQLIKADQTIRLGSFASDLELTPRKNRAIIPVRGKRRIVIVDVDPSNGGENLMSCSAEDERTCDTGHHVESNDQVSLPIEPYEIATLEYSFVNRDDEGNPTSTTFTTMGFATHLSGGEVSMFRIDKVEIDQAEIDQAETLIPELLTIDPELLTVDTSVLPGASGIAANSSRGEIYVSGRRDPSPHLAIMKTKGNDLASVERKPYFDNAGSISFGSDLYGGTDARGVAVTQSGDTIFLVTRTPEALLKIDTADREIVDMTTLGADPSVVALYEAGLDTPDPSDDITTAWVLCFLSDQVYIVESNNMQVHVRTTGFGPHAIAFDKVKERAYIANFRESTITVINTTWPYGHVGFIYGDTKANIKIGKPRLPSGHS